MFRLTKGSDKHSSKQLSSRETAEDAPSFEIGKDIVDRFKQGDTEAFKYIYAKFRQRIFSYCLYFTGDQVLAEDAFQETFARAYTRREQLKEHKALKSWLLLITRSVCLNMLRTSKFTPDFVSIDAPHSQTGEQREFAELSHEPLESHVSEDILQHALAKLSPMHRDAFLLREFEGYTYEEIAELTQVSVMNVKVRITRAKKQLREILTPYYAVRGDKSTRDKNTKGPQNPYDQKKAATENADEDSEWLTEKGAFAR